MNDEKPRIRSTADVVKENMALKAQVNWLNQELRNLSDIHANFKAMSVWEFFKFKTGI
jgi:hypothetical protein